MKDHKKETRYIHIGRASVESWIAELTEVSKDLVDPIVDQRFAPDYLSGESWIYVEGWRPLTAAELAAAEKKRQKEKERRSKAAKKAAQTRIANEKKELARLKKKYEEK